MPWLEKISVFFFCFQRLLGFKSHNIVEFTQSGEKIVEKRK